MAINSHWITSGIKRVPSHPICSCRFACWAVDYVPESESPLASNHRRGSRRCRRFWLCRRPDLVFSFLFLLGLLQGKYRQSQGRQFRNFAVVLLFCFSICTYGTARAVCTRRCAPLANSRLD